MPAPKDQDATLIAEELARLGELSLGEIRARYLHLTESALPTHVRTGFGRLALGYALQEASGGNLERAYARRLDALVAGIVTKDAAKPRPKNRKLRTGTRLMRQWKGRIYEVSVTASGFEWDGRTWNSLTEIARAITGTNWNGWVFFGVKKPKAKSGSKSAAPSTEKEAAHV